MKIKTFLLLFFFGSLAALYSYFIPDTIQTRITDAQMTKVDGRFMIATEYRPLVNEDAKYRFKFDSGTVQNEAIRLKGKKVMIKKYGWRIPIFSMSGKIYGPEFIELGLKIGEKIYLFLQERFSEELRQKS